MFVSGDRASEEREADVGASDSLGRAEVCVWRSAVTDVDQPLRWTQTANLSPQTHLEGRGRVLCLTTCLSNTTQWRDSNQTAVVLMNLQRLQLASQIPTGCF